MASIPPNLPPNRRSDETPANPATRQLTENELRTVLAVAMVLFSISIAGLAPLLLSMPQSSPLLRYGEQRDTRSENALRRLSNLIRSSFSNLSISGVEHNSEIEQKNCFVTQHASHFGNMRKKFEGFIVEEERCIQGSFEAPVVSLGLFSIFLEKQETLNQYVNRFDDEVKEKLTSALKKMQSQVNNLKNPEAVIDHLIFAVLSDLTLSAKTDALRLFKERDPNKAVPEDLEITQYTNIDPDKKLEDIPDCTALKELYQTLYCFQQTLSSVDRKIHMQMLRAAYAEYYEPSNSEVLVTENELLQRLSE